MKSNISEGLDFVFTRATAEVAATNSNTMTIDHVFLGLLKLAELPFDSDSDFSKCSFGNEIKAAKEYFNKREINTMNERFRIRGILRNERDNQKSEQNLIALMGMLVHIAETGNKNISVKDMLTHLSAFSSDLMFPVIFPDNIVEKETIENIKYDN